MKENPYGDVPTVLLNPRRRLGHPIRTEARTVGDPVGVLLGAVGQSEVDRSELVDGPELLDSYSRPVVSVAEHVGPAVVSIAAGARTVDDMHPMMVWMSFGEALKERLPRKSAVDVSLAPVESL